MNMAESNHRRSRGARGLHGYKKNILCKNPTESAGCKVTQNENFGLKRTGDGALVEFRSVVEAVRCAITIQNAMAERNGGTPTDQRIVFRIGIHLGDVVEESDGDQIGDGVNIAARLEGIAQPAAICLSEDAGPGVIVELI